MHKERRQFRTQIELRNLNEGERPMWLNCMDEQLLCAFIVAQIITHVDKGAAFPFWRQYFVLTFLLHCVLNLVISCVYSVI
jgi:hypothetical protein